MTMLERLLTKSIMKMVIAVDLSDNDVIEPEVAMALVEPVTTLLQGCRPRIGEPSSN